VPLSELRERFTPEELILLRRGNRLSVVPVPEAVFKEIVRLAHEA
jgi:predicted RNA-binding protein with PUA-like domain